MKKAQKQVEITDCKEARMHSLPLCKKLVNPLLSRVYEDFEKVFDNGFDKTNHAYMLYKPAKIYDGGGLPNKPWFVYFYTRPTPDALFVRQRVYGSLMLIKDRKARREIAELLKKTINTSLKDGRLLAAPQEIDEQKNRYYYLLGALSEVLKKKLAGLRPDTKKTYENHLKLFGDWCKKRKMASLPLNMFKGTDLQDYQSFMVDSKLSPTTVNSRMENICGLFKKLDKLGLLEKNPINSIEPLREEEGAMFMPYTADELIRISEHLKINDPRLHLYWLHVYYCFLRPATISQLKRSHYNFVEKTIDIMGGIHKNRKSAKKQILAPFLEHLLNAGTKDLLSSDYVFSTDLLPGAVFLDPNQVAKRWNKQVIKGLGIGKKMYAAKHTGAIDYLEANATSTDTAWLQSQMGHSSLAETEKYIKKRSVKRLDESKANIKNI